MNEDQVIDGWFIRKRTAFNDNSDKYLGDLPINHLKRLFKNDQRMWTVERQKAIATSLNIDHGYVQCWFVQQIIRNNSEKTKKRKLSK